MNWYMFIFTRSFTFWKPLLFSQPSIYGKGFELNPFSDMITALQRLDFLFSQRNWNSHKILPHGTRPFLFLWCPLVWPSLPEPQSFPMLSSPSLTALAPPSFSHFWDLLVAETDEHCWSTGIMLFLGSVPRQCLIVYYSFLQLGCCSLYLWLYVLLFIYW